MIGNPFDRLRSTSDRGPALRHLLVAVAALAALAGPPAVTAQEQPPPQEPPAGAAPAPAAGEEAGAEPGALPPGSPPPAVARGADGSPGGSRVVGVRRFRPAEEPEKVSDEAAAPDEREADDRRARLGDMIALRVQGLEPVLEAAGSCDGILLYLEGMPLEGNTARSCDAEDGEVRFRLVRNERDDSDWHALLGSPSTLVRNVRVSLGTDDKQPLRSSADLELVVLPRGVLWVFCAVLALGLWLFWRLARRTDMLRDRQAQVPAGERRPYSLARVQMAWWFALVVAAYVFIWLVLGELDTITESVLALIGIGSGTALGAAMIDQQKKQAERQAVVGARAAQAAAPAAASEGAAELAHAVRVARIQAEAEDRAGSVKGASRGFVTDVLSDGDGISFHRFQMLTWTLVLGAIFVASVYGTLQMPEFSATLLALMGISNGTYLGFKLPERFDREAPGAGPPPDGPPGGPGAEPGEPDPAEPPPSEPASERVLAG